MKNNNDIFDKIMSLPVLNIFEPFYKKQKEILLYLFFGGLSFLVNIFTFDLFNVVLSVNELIANVISWIITVMFAFLTNRIWVFNSRVKTVLGFFVQMLKFYGGRILTLLIEELIIYIFITRLCYPSMPVKLAAQVIVIVLNYIISKLGVFKKME